MCLSLEAMQFLLMKHESVLYIPICHIKGNPRDITYTPYSIWSSIQEFHLQCINIQLNKIVQNARRVIFLILIYHLTNLEYMYSY